MLLMMPLIKRRNSIYTNGNTNVAKINKPVNQKEQNYTKKIHLAMTVIISQRKIEHTNNITNNRTRHNHNNYEHDVIKNY